MIKKIINTGINVADWYKESHDEKDYYVGAGQITKTLLFKDGHGMQAYLPTPEFQKKKLETMACVSFSHNNCIETLGNYYKLGDSFKVDFNISDRGLAKMSGTTTNGNSPNNVCEAFRKQGFLWEAQYPYPDDILGWNEFYQALPEYLKQEALKNLALLDYSHEWVYMNKTAMMSALQFGPIQGIGFAWIFDSNRGVYVDGGYSPTHAFIIFDYVYGKHWLVYDTYTEDYLYDGNSPQGEFIKKLDWSFRFGAWGKQMYIKPTLKKNENIFVKLKTMFENLVHYMDDHGLHIWYMDNRGKQEIPLETIADKAMYMQMCKAGIIKAVAGFGAIAGYPNFKFF